MSYDDQFYAKNNEDYYNNSPQYSNGTEDYLIFSILVTIFCCLPFGIPAIVYSALAKGKYEAGDYSGGRRNAETAKGWCIAAFVSGLILLFLAFVS